MKSCMHRSSSFDGSHDQGINGEQLHCFYFGEEKQKDNSLHFSRTKNSFGDKINANRVRFSSVLVTAVETRPRTRTEDKPNLYWTANEIATLRLQQSLEDSLNTKAGSSSGSLLRRKQGEIEHELFLRSRANVDALERRIDYSNSSPRMVVLEEEYGPHLLCPSLDCEWLQ
mmetsp:Transcript_2032/g.3114  ORF Transcript_2032/g.3114 Transcript_2032/m.3114 type:complete len:171 (+) Transcript_2032:228-740(+)